MLAGITVAGLWFVILVCAMAEAALAFASRAKLEEALEGAARRARYFRYLDRAGPAKVLCTALRVAALAAMLGVIAARAPERGYGLAWPMAAAAACAIAAELAGRLVGKRWATIVLIVVLPPLQVAGVLMLPLAPLRRKPAAGDSAVPDEQVVDAAREEIRVAIEDAASEGALQADEKDMIEGVLEFEDVEVHEIMTPRTEMECLEASTSLAETMAAVAGFHHSRIPVYEGVRDKVVGVVRVKDLPAAAGRDASLRELMRQPFFVPETKRAVSLLRDFKQRHVHIAIILDEYGGVTGLVTVEDVVEQIVGELEDDPEAASMAERVRTLGPGEMDIDARLRVDEVNDLFDVDLPEEEDYDTIGGFMMASFASVPQEGEELRYNGVLLRVLESDDRQVRRVLLRRLAPGETDQKQH